MTTVPGVTGARDRSIRRAKARRNAQRRLNHTLPHGGADAERRPADMTMATLLAERCRIRGAPEIHTARWQSTLRMAGRPSRTAAKPRFSAAGSSLGLSTRSP